MKIAIMQPYFAPYLGYFQLIKEVDTFIFYDDVNFIKKGWIHRNYININGELKMFTIPLVKSSQSKKINKTEINWNCRDMEKLLKTFQYNLKDTTILNQILFEKPKTISDMAILSIKLFCKQLKIKTKFKKSSELNYKKQNDKALNLIEICKSENSTEYINPEGGKSLYTKNQFISHGVNLKFIKGLNSPSMLETISNKKLIKQINNYTLI
tara:strand:- start:10365 stop:10997 length:633 start_codon:yes stop_codon:yes gene_type:complete